MSKIKAFLAKPITWGAYFKLCGLATAVSAVIIVSFCRHYCGRTCMDYPRNYLG